MLRLICFGGLRFHSAGETIPTFLGQPKRLALLALLAAAGKRGLGRDRVLLYLWPESESERARNALKQIVHKVRGELGEGSIRTTPAGDLQLDREQVTSDVWDFRQAIQRGDVEQAASLHLGPFLDGFYVREAPEFERWVEVERGRLRELYCQALERLADAATSRGDHATAVRYGRIRSEVDPLSSRAARAYVASLVAAGERERALQYGAEYIRLVRSELGAEPDAGVTQLLESARRMA